MLTKPFAAAYIVAPLPPPLRAATLVTLMIEPPPARRRCGTAAAQATTSERTLRLMTSSKNASVVSCTGTRATRPPALLIEHVEAPEALRGALDDLRARSADTLKSPATVKASPPAAPISAASASAAAALEW